MPSTLKEILNLAKKTGDTVIVAHENETASVIMPLQRYRELILEKNSRQDTQKTPEESANEAICLWKNKEEVRTLDNSEYCGTMAGLSEENVAGILPEDKPEIPFEQLSSQPKKPVEDEVPEDYFYIEPVE